MDKQNVAHMPRGILFSPQKEGSADTGYDMDEPGGHHVKWNKPGTERQVVRDSTHMRFSE